MYIDSTRFGRFEVEDDLLLTFPDGLIGLPGTRYVLVAQSATAPFYWLHSVDHAEVAVPDLPQVICQTNFSATEP